MSGIFCEVIYFEVALNDWNFALYSTSHHQPKTLIWKMKKYCIFSFFFLEDEEDEEMVEPKVGHDSELENQDKKQETKEGKETKEGVVGRYTGSLLGFIVFFYQTKRR